MPLRLTLEARPGRKIPSITVRNGTLVVSVTERPVAGRANAAIERAVAAWLGVRAATVTIVHGAAGRRKQIDIDGVDPVMVARRIAACSKE